MPILYLLLLACCWGCGTEPLVTPHSNATGDAPPGRNALSALSFEPNRSPARVEPITAISIELHGTTPTDASPYLVEGTLSQVSLTKLKNGELTAAFAERLVPIVTRDIASGWRIRPEVPLKQGGTYTVASRLGSHGVFQVGPSDYVPVGRVWPPAGGGAIAGIYCGPLAPSEAADVSLENGNVAHLLPGLNDDGLRLGSCIRLLWGPIGDESVQLPPAMATYSLDPERLPSGPIPEQILALTCTSPELPLGLGCASLAPGMIVVRPPSLRQLWALGWNGRFQLQFAADGRRFVIPELGLEPVVVMSVTVFDMAGREYSSHARVPLPPPAAHIVINEVMANPFGTEPTQEWIELFNAGTADGELSELSLRDSEGEVALR